MKSRRNKIREEEMRDVNQSGEKFQELVGILARLRGPGGCPWDREQDERSIADYFLEEVYEAVDALRAGDPAALAEELGDVLMEVVFLSRIFEEKGAFTIADAVAGINAKMVRRHPHVFGDEEVGSADRVLEAWVARKKVEKKRSSHFEGVAAAAPALLAAFQIGQRASQSGFDWPSAGEALAKVGEEAAELRAAMDAGDTEGVAEELGDCLFALANVSRLLKINPETALRAANEKFVGRFIALEDRLRAGGRSLEKATPAEMDEAWEGVKRSGRGGLIL
jgi:MazG family protein